ncbi:unnamed protein product [Oppiella nova]|uniref:hypoxia-inducible factor-proline dioxygenase n=1 Tax=Oppiella nova TaxID=334625 RepID=A0A7R9LEW1_9ACAR|nr:unnamed protein product [Oppiella nova]CAG2162949.1 unnamed protein product [Oppiella nova]
MASNCFVEKYDNMSSPVATRRDTPHVNSATTSTSLLCDSVIDHLIDLEGYDKKFDHLLPDIIDISTDGELGVGGSKLDKICQEVVQKLNCVGMCVIDNFLDDVAPHIHNEVYNLYDSTDFTYGMLYNNNTIRNIRGDLIYWITGNEVNCPHVHDLIKTFDLIVFKCNKMNNNGLLGVYNITSRTPAMLACFPGNGSRFMKHADNYSGDGRCITCIYYVNKEWQYLRDGGCLRVYPTQMQMNVPFVDVEPVYDRLVLFWSDRRNLHEVMPANRFRFAVTVWYFDDEERRRYKTYRTLT